MKAIFLLSGDHEFTLIEPCPPKSFINVLGLPPDVDMIRSSTFLLGKCSSGFKSPFL